MCVLIHNIFALDGKKVNRTRIIKEVKRLSNYLYLCFSGKE